MQVKINYICMWTAVAIDSASQTYAAGFNATSTINIGYLDLSPFYYFNGNVDEVAFFNAALPLFDIQKHYYKGSKGYGYCSIIPPIAAPSNLQAVKNSIDTTNVNLSWHDNSSNELGFVIQRKNGDLTSVASVFYYRYCNRKRNIIC